MAVEAFGGRVFPDPLPAPERLQVGFETYLSPFTYRYGTQQMRELWSEQTFWSNVRRVWIAVAETQQQAGIVTQEQVDDLKTHFSELSVERIFQWERDREYGTGHDVAAAAIEYSEVAPLGGKILSQGLTSEDTLSNAEIIQIQAAFDLIRPKLVGTLDGFGKRIGQYKDLVCMGATHLQVAEPTTYGYRFAKYAQDLLIDLQLLDTVSPWIKGKGIKGPVGTSGSFVDILKGTGMSAAEHERLVMEKLGIESVTISDQTYPRKFLLLTENVLSNIGQSLHRFGLDIQILQSSATDEVSETGEGQRVNSMAMPHKVNPVNTENIDSLTEELPGENFAAWMTAAFVTLERTLRDSGGKRTWLPESFMIVDEALTRAERVIRSLVVHENSVRTNLEKFAPYTVTEIILGRLVNAGMDRKDAHSILRIHSRIAREYVRNGTSNPIKQLILEDNTITEILGADSIKQAFDDIFHHVGDAPQRCVDFLEQELYPATEK